MKLKADAQRLRDWMDVMEKNPQDYVGKDTSGDIEYSAVGKGEEVNKVVAVLKRGKSAKYTRLGNNFLRMQQLKEEIDRVNDEMKEDLRGAIADIFNPEDAVYTRVIETAQFVIQITKDPKAAETVQYAKVLAELESKLTPELLEALKIIKNKYTSVQKAKPPSITNVEKKTEESIDLSEGVWDAIKSIWSKFASSIKSWLNGYDRRLAALKAEVGVHESEQLTSLDTLYNELAENACKDEEEENDNSIKENSEYEFNELMSRTTRLLKR